jgi:perosamine synthetase
MINKSIENIEFFNTSVSSLSVKYINEVLNSKRLSAGKYADDFENGLSSQLGLINPVSVNSGTSALHLALIVAGVGPGDEVILPAQTFIATGFVVMMQGAIPIFADIQLNTGNLDPVSVRNKITEKTKAIIPVHWGGYPCDLDEINAIAIEFDLTVIEDAAHALGAIYKGRPIGSISHFTAFSFQAIKHLTCGDGGALCCQNKNSFHEAKKRRWFDIDRENSNPDILGERIYNAANIGYKYHLNDLSAAVGLGNLSGFSSNSDRIQKIASAYTAEFVNIEGLKLLENKGDRKSAFWLFTVLVEDRLNFIKALKSRNVPASVVHLRIDKNAVFGGIKEDLIQQEVFDKMQVSIPIHANLTDDHISRIIDAVKLGW